MEQDSDYFSEDSGELNRKLDDILESYERAAKSEQFLLLSFIYPLTQDYQLQSGISPARGFSPAIGIIQRRTQNQIIFSTFEWSDFMKTISEMQHSFFKCKHSDEDRPRPPVSCGDFLHVSQLVYEGVKQLMVMKNLTAIYLSELDVDTLININNLLVAQQIQFLDNFNFCSYYFNALSTLTELISTHKTILSIEELLEAFCKSSDDSLYTLALRQYLYYFKGKINMI